MEFKRLLLYHFYEKILSLKFEYLKKNPIATVVAYYNRGFYYNLHNWCYNIYIIM